MDDLVDYYRSIPGRSFPWGEPFTYLKVESCLYDVPWPLDECVERVTPLGRAAEDLLIPRTGRAFFSALGILELCLYGCEPFRGLTEPKIKDVRPKVPKPRDRIQDCPRRSDLFCSLVGTLFGLESSCRFDSTWMFFAAAWDRSRDFHQQVESWLTKLRRRETALTDPTLHHQSRALIKAMQ
jgi:hypothetical protein